MQVTNIYIIFLKNTIEYWRFPNSYPEIKFPQLVLLIFLNLRYVFINSAL